MYNKQELDRKVDEMFEDLKRQSYEIINSHSDFSDVSKRITEMISSEIVMRSKTLTTDIYAQMSKDTLSSTMFNNDEREFQFYKSNIRGDILSKYQFDITTINIFKNGIQHKELHRLYWSLGVSAVTAAVGGILKYALNTKVNEPIAVGGILKDALNTKVNVPIVVIIAGAVAAFCVSYFIIIPNKNKENFQRAVEDFLSELKEEFIEWFKKIEIYYNERIQGLVNTFKEGGQI